jgi:hypothetical protein
MVDSTTLGGGSEAPVFVAPTPLRRRSEAAHVESLREKVRELGVDLRRNWGAGQARAPVAETEAARWADQLAEEYFDDFVQAAPGPEEAEERHVWAERAYAAARLAFAASAAAAPVAALAVGFVSARMALAMRVLLAVLLVLAVAGLLRDWPKAGAPAAAPAPAPAFVWAEIGRPLPLFDLSAPMFGRERPAYAARRHVAGGGREDTLALGVFGGPRPFLRFSLYRHGGEEVADAEYFVDMARRAASSGLAVKGADLPRALPTRFGTFESAPLQLSGPSGVVRGNCRGFRLDIAAPALTMGGLLCGGGDEAIAAADVACVIDRLDLVSAGQDRALADFFGAAQARKSRACGEAAARK